MNEKEQAIYTGPTFSQNSFSSDSRVWKVRFPTKTREAMLVSGWASVIVCRDQVCERMD